MASERVKWIDHKGKRILFIDCAGLSGEAYLKTLDEVEVEYKKLGQNSSLVLIDVTGSSSNNQTTERQKKLAGMKVAKHAAVVGVTGVKKVIASAVNRSFYYAGSVNAAKDWLASQD